MSVVYDNKEYKVKKKGGLLSLDLSHMNIMDISEIKGLETLTGLQVLILNFNNIKKIKNLETLVNLEHLELEYNHIEVLEGLDNLKKLKYLSLFSNEIAQIKSFENKGNLKTFYFSKNPIYDDINTMFGSAKTQDIVEYSRMSIEKKEHKLEERSLEIPMDVEVEIKMLRKELDATKRKVKDNKYALIGIGTGFIIYTLLNYWIGVLFP
jgi:hypothetical protein